jgi:hypothetical protein
MVHSLAFGYDHHGEAVGCAGDGDFGVPVGVIRRVGVADGVGGRLTQREGDPGVERGVGEAGPCEGGDDFVAAEGDRLRGGGETPAVQLCHAVLFYHRRRLREQLHRRPDRRVSSP